MNVRLLLAMFLVCQFSASHWYVRGTICKWMKLGSVDASFLCTDLGSSIYICETNQLLKSTKKYQPNQPTHKTNSTHKTSQPTKLVVHNMNTLGSTSGKFSWEQSATPMKLDPHHRKLLSTTNHITFKNFAGQPISGTKWWAKMYFGNLPLHHWHHDKNMSHCNIRFPAKFSTSPSREPQRVSNKSVSYLLVLPKGSQPC